MDQETLLQVQEEMRLKEEQLQDARNRLGLKDLACLNHIAEMKKLEKKVAQMKKEFNKLKGAADPITDYYTILEENRMLKWKLCNQENHNMVVEWEKKELYKRNVELSAKVSILEMVQLLSGTQNLTIANETKPLSQTVPNQWGTLPMLQLLPGLLATPNQALPQGVSTPMPNIQRRASVPTHPYARPLSG